MLKRVISTLFILSASTSAVAEWFVQPKVGVEQRSYTLQIGDDSDNTAKSSISSLLVGMSLINSDGWYVDAEVSSGDGTVSDFYPEDDRIEINAFTFTAGKQLGAGWTLFGGANISDTIIHNDKDQVNQGESFNFNSVGFFAGIAKTFIPAKGHSINLSGALGALSGSYKNETNGGIQDFDAEGNAIGYSASISYSFRFTPKAALTAGFKAQSYTYTNMTDSDTDVEYADATESFSSIFAKASYAF